MAENNNIPVDQTGTTQQTVSVKRIYVTDVSFESPNSPDVFQQQSGPKVDFNLSTKSRVIKDSYYEVSLRLTAEAKFESKTLFLVEVVQAGIFEIKGISGEEMEHVLASMCPGILFPYARETIDSLVLKGTFPPLMLDPINFDAIFMQNRQDKNAPQGTLSS